MDSFVSTALAPVLSFLMGLAACFLAAGGCLLCYRAPTSERKKLLTNSKNSPIVTATKEEPKEDKENQTSGYTYSLTDIKVESDDNSSDGFVVLSVPAERTSDAISESGHVDSTAPPSSTDTAPSSSCSASESGFSESYDNGHYDNVHRDNRHHDNGHRDNGHHDNGHHDNGHRDIGHRGNGHHDNGHRDIRHHGNGHRDNGHRDNGHRDNGHRDNGHRDIGHHDNGHRDNGHRDNGNRDKGHREKKAESDKRKSSVYVSANQGFVNSPPIPAVRTPPIPKPSAKLYVCYSQVMSLLSIRLVAVSHLPLKAAGQFCCVSAKVLPDRRTSKSTKIVQIKGTEATFQESLNFQPVPEEDLEVCTIRIAVHLVFEGQKTFVGEKYIRCAKLPLRSGKSYYIEEPLRSRRLVNRNSTTEDDGVSNVGSLLVVLHHDPALRSLQVTVHKAENLAPRNIFPSTPRYYVVTKLLADGEVIEVHKSHDQPGANPTWRHACVFKTPREFSKSCSLQLDIMRMHRYKKDSVAGHVTIGPNAGKSGASHWSTMLQPRSSGSALWHDLKSPS